MTITIGFHSGMRFSIVNELIKEGTISASAEDFVNHRLCSKLPKWPSGHSVHMGILQNFHQNFQELRVKNIRLHLLK